MAFKYGLDTMDFDQALAIGNENLSAEIHYSAVGNISDSEERVEKIIESGEVVYGINTGFGPLCNTVIPADQTAKLQRTSFFYNLIPETLTFKKLKKSIIIFALMAFTHNYSDLFRRCAF